MKFVRPAMLLFAIGGALILPKAANAQWTAYNDFAWTANPNFIFATQGLTETDPDYRITPGDINSGLDKVTLYTSGNDYQYVNSPDYYAPDPAVEPTESSGEQARSGYLRNYNTGSALTARATVNHTGETSNWGTQQGAGFAATPGTDAYEAFYDQETGEPIVGMWGIQDGNDESSIHTVTLSGLDPNKHYEYTTFGNFGWWGAGNLWRWTKIEGHDESGFQNLSSVDTDYATAINLDAGDPNDPQHSVGHEQRAVIRDESDPSHYVQASGDIWFDGFVTKFRFKPGEDGEVDIVTRGVQNDASMENITVVDSTDTTGAFRWWYYKTDRTLDSFRQYQSGWREHSDPNQWPADPDVLETTAGVINSNWYLNAFKLEELAAEIENADFDGDGDIDGSDFLTWQRNLGSGSQLLEGDANGDSVVDATDLAIWEQQFGSLPSFTAVNAVPEPCSLLLTLSALACLGGRRHCKV